MPLVSQGNSIALLRKRVVYCAHKITRKKSQEANLVWTMTSDIPDKKPINAPKVDD